MIQALHVWSENILAKLKCFSLYFLPTDFHDYHSELARGKLVNLILLSEKFKVVHIFVVYFVYNWFISKKLFINNIKIETNLKFVTI
jgi:hypothetical protein